MKYFNIQNSARYVWKIIIYLLFLTKFAKSDKNVPVKNEQLPYCGGSDANDHRDTSRKWVPMFDFLRFFCTLWLNKILQRIFCAWKTCCLMSRHVFFHCLRSIHKKICNFFIRKTKISVHQGHKYIGDQAVAYWLSYN